MAEGGGVHTNVVDQHARDLGQRVLARLERHEEVCNHMRRSQSQWQESAIRVLSEIKEAFAEHAKADAAFQEAIYKQFGNWNRFVIIGLCTLLGGTCTIIGALVAHIILK